MKKATQFKIPILCAILALLAACRHPPGEIDLPTWLPGDMLKGKVTAKRQNDAWIGSAAGRYGTPEAGYFYFQGWTEDSDGFVVESLYIQVIPLAPGKYPVKKKPVVVSLDGIADGSFSFRDYDITLSFYDTDNDAPASFVEVLSYDSLTHRVTGTFNVHFVKSDLTIGEAFPDRLYFSEGTFDIYLTKYE